jgi:hypothetical protein
LRPTNGKKDEWNPKGGSGSKLKRRRETSETPTEAWDPNSKEEEIRVESQGKLGIQTQKKKRNEWNPKGSLGSKLKRRRETSGIPREAWDPNSKEEHLGEEAPYSTPYLLPSQRKLSSESGDGTREEEVGLKKGWKMTW